MPYRPGMPSTSTAWMAPVFRFGRTTAPVPVAAGEGGARRSRIERNFRNMVPDWRWNGPSIPDTKPPFRELYVGQEGRYWVLVSQEGTPTDEPLWDPEPGEPSAPNRWDEPVRFDVFEGDGSYLGAVDAPAGFQIYPTPVFRGDRVWAVVEDELGVERVVGFRVTGGR